MGHVRQQYRHVFCGRLLPLIQPAGRWHIANTFGGIHLTDQHHQPKNLKYYTSIVQTIPSRHEMDTGLHIACRPQSTSANEFSNAPHHPERVANFGVAGFTKLLVFVDFIFPQRLKKGRVANPFASTPLEEGRLANQFADPPPPQAPGCQLPPARLPPARLPPAKDIVSKNG